MIQNLGQCEIAAGVQGACQAREVGYIWAPTGFSWELDRLYWYHKKALVVSYQSEEPVKKDRDQSDVSKHLIMLLNCF